MGIRYIYIYLILLNIYIMNGFSAANYSTFSDKTGGGGGGGGGWQGEVWLRLANSRQGFQN